MNYHDTGRKNLLHAYSACDDPDCEIHNPECIEDYSSRATAKAWYSAGMLAVIDEIQQGLRDGTDEWTSIDNAQSGLEDSHTLREFVEVADGGYSKGVKP